MRRRGAHRVWLGYQGVEAFAFALGWTVAPIFFIRELGFSPLELVLAGTALEVAYFLFEIPTGIVADTYGRRLSVIVGLFGLGIGFVATGLAGGVAVVLAAAAFTGFAWTFKSGAESAWITDEVGVERSGRAFQHGAQAARAGALLGIAAAVGLALVDLRLPIVAGGVLLVLLGGALAVVMPETGFRSARREDSTVRATVLSMTNVFESAGEWGGGPALGGIGNAFGVRAALAGSAVVLLPALALYGRAVRHHSRDPDLATEPAAV